MSEALTHRHVDFLRDLMESKAREGLENGTIEIVEDLQTLGLVKHDLISGVGFRYWATPAGRILVATIDSERERVLAEAMNVVRDAAAFEESQGDGAVTSNYLRELADRIERGERPPFEHTRAGLAYPYPQGETDQ